MRSEAPLRSATSLRAYQGDLSSIVALDRETERQLARVGSRATRRRGVGSSRRASPS